MADYKAIQFTATIHHKSIKDPSLTYDDTKEVRYCIVSTKTGEVLDDAQGYGYTTEQKAYAGYIFKQKNDLKKIKQKKHIKQWMEEHKSFVNKMNRVALKLDASTNNVFDAPLVEKMLSDYKLKPDFTAKELLEVWRQN